MPKKKLPKLYKRKWLNEKQGTALIEVDFNVEEQSSSGNLTNWGYIVLKDCTRQCSLEFDYYDEAGYKQRLKKIRLLKALITEAEEFMVANPFVKASKKPAESEKGAKATLVRVSTFSTLDGL